MRTAVFDFDHTIVRMDSFAGFIIFMLRRSAWRLALAGVLAPLSLLLTRRSKTLTLAFSIFLWIATVGVTDGVFAELISRYIRHSQRPRRERVGNLAYQDALTRLKAHAESGDRVVIVTGAATVLAAPLCKDLGIPADLVLGSSLKRWCGGYVAALHCHGRRKLGILAASGVVPPWDFVYTDSAVDLPILAAGQKRYLVNPSPRSRERIAQAGVQVEELQWT